jgi:hypothetical protein
MRYDEIVGRAWTILWRHRYLWLLGLLGGGEASFGFPGLPGFGPSGGQPPTLRLGAVPAQLATWPSDHLALLVVLGVLLLAYALAYFLVSCAATPALVRAAAEHDAGRPFGLRIAWRVGVGTFPRLLGLRLLVLLAWLVALAILAALLGVTAVLAVSHQTLAAIAAGLFLAGLVLLLIPGGVALGLVVTLAVRAIVLEQLGVLAAIARGSQLLYRRLGRVLLLWFLQLALALVIGLALAAATLALGGLLVAIGIGGFAGFGVSGGLTTAVVLLFVLIVLTVPLAGAANTYLNVYWTLAFRRLELPSAPPYPIVPGYPPPAGVHPAGGP